jgi:hypothetical protein
MFRNAKQTPNQYTSVGSIFTISLLKIHDRMREDQQRKRKYIVRAKYKWPPSFLVSRIETKAENAKQERHFFI